MTMNWPEAYRPTTLDEMALGSENRKLFSGWIKDGDIPSLLLSGPRGTGKTTVARILSREVLGKVKWLNASKERGIDVIRDDVVTWASVHPDSQTGEGPRCIVMDEAHRLTPEATDALRGVIDDYADRCRFIVITNYPDQEETDFGFIRSRLQWRPMPSPPAEERQRRLQEVLHAEEVEYTEHAVGQLVEQFTDMRPILHEAEKLARLHDGALPTEIDVPETVVETIAAVAKLEEDKTVDMVSQTALAKELGRSKGTVSDRVHNAAERGLIDNSNPGSGSSADWYVTDRGRQLLQDGA